MDIELRIVRKISHDTRIGHIDILHQRRKNIHSDASYVGGPEIFRWSDWEDVPIIFEEV